MCKCLVLISFILVNLLMWGYSSLLYLLVLEETRTTRIYYPFNIIFIWTSLLFVLNIYLFALILYLVLGVGEKLLFFFFFFLLIFSSLKQLLYGMRVYIYLEDSHIYIRTISPNHTPQIKPSYALSPTLNDLP